MISVLEASFIVTVLSEAKLVADLIWAVDPSSKVRFAWAFKSTPCEFNSDSHSIPFGLEKSYPITLPTANLEIDIG